MTGKPQSFQALRPLHFSEKWEDSLHHAAQYYSAALTVRYVSNNRINSEGAHPVYNAIAELVRRHGALQVGIARDAKGKAFFTDIPQIDLRKHVSFTTLACDTHKEYQDKLLKFLAEQHDRPWQDQPTTPPWKLVVLKPLLPEGAERGAHEEEFAFFSHHALMDGTSLRLFHEQLLSALNAAPMDTDASAAQVYIVDLPNKAPLPRPREEVIPAQLGKLFLAKNVWQHYGPGMLKKTPTLVWRGAKVNLDKPNQTRFALVEVAQASVRCLLQACKAHEATLSGMLHALLLASLAQRLTTDEAVAFHSETYIDYRFLPQKTVGDVQTEYGDNLANCFAVSCEKHRPPLVSAFREPDRDLDALVWSNAKRITELVRAKREALPLNDMMNLIKFIPDLDQEFSGLGGTDRRASWSISNLMVLGRKNPKEALSGSERAWKVDWALFTQGGEMAGPAINLNLISVADGVLALNFNWLEGVVSDELVAGVVNDLEKWLVDFAAKQRFEAQ